MKKIALLLAALTVTACSSTQEAYDIRKVTETRSPTVAADAPTYEWDDEKSFALNVAHLDGEQVGLRDMDSPEDAQKDVSDGYRLGNFLINTWAGTATQAAAHDRVVAARQDSYKFDPYAIVFIDQNQVEKAAEKGDEAVFEMVLDVLRTELTQPIIEKYNDDSVEVLAWNQATNDYVTENHRVNWSLDTDFVLVLKNDACTAGKQDDAIGTSSIPAYDAQRAYTLTGLASPSHCRIFGSIKAVAETQLPGDMQQSVAFKVTLDNNYYTPTLALKSDLTWVVSTEWKDGFQTQTAAYPFVTYDDKVWLFTHSNDNFSLSDIR